MNSIKVGSLAEFEEQLESISESLNELRTQREGNYFSDMLFRGQASSNWKLETSLDRIGLSSISMTEYNQYMLRIKPAIESLTGQSYTVDEFDNDKFLPATTVPSYHFMTYVRHHSFPTPLLDWSRSPYVALFFAFQKAIESDSVSIYVYIDCVGEGKGGYTKEPMIHEMGSYISTHKRHFLQQSHYNVCIKKESNNWIYCDHESFYKSTADKDQCVMYKIELPGSLKKDVLKKLDMMNINAFSLYANEEGLMEMLAFREMINDQI